MLRFDHLAVSAATLAEGVAHVEAALGIPLVGGGLHPHMATHNRLLGLGDLYLEVIAANPEAPAPAWPRWFDLDRFEGTPRLTNWVAACADLDAVLPMCPPGTGHPVALQRGDYHWHMAVPANGQLPFDGAFPALIAWQGSLHPTAALPDAGVRLLEMQVTHPDAAALRAALPGFTDPRVVFATGAEKSLQASFSTPHGRRHL